VSALDTRLIDALSVGARGQGGQPPTQGEVEAASRAAGQLGALGDPKAVGPLVRALSAPSPELREAICDALGALGDLRATNPLLSALRDPHEDVRGAAFTALLVIGQRRANAMPDASAWESHFADPTAALTQIAWQTDVEAVKLLQAALGDADAEVRIGAAYTLSHLGVLSALEPIAQLLYHDPDEEVRGAAAYSLGELALRGTRQTADFAAQALAWAWSRPGVDNATQGAALRALSELGRPEAARLFYEALSHPDAVLRQLAVMGLGRLRDAAALPHLSAALHDPDYGVRRNAAYAIGFLVTTPPGAPAQAQPADLHARVARAVVAGAAGQGGEERAALGASLRRVPRSVALSAIAEALRGGEPPARAAAAYLLGHVPDELGLKEALRDPDAEVRKRAALAAGSAQLPALRLPLEATLADPEWSARVAAAEGLRRLQDPRALTALRAALGDPHPVAQNAIEAAVAALTPLERR
jgi:HEAT repeat protein